MGLSQEREWLQVAEVGKRSWKWTEAKKRRIAGKLKQERGTERGCGRKEELEGADTGKRKGYRGDKQKRD